MGNRFAQLVRIGDPNRQLRSALLMAAAMLSLFALVQSMADMRRFPGTDLRARVVGARAMLAGLDPYHIPVDPAQTEQLQDPDRYAFSFSRCTYPPTLLLVYGALAELPYRAQRWIWFAMEWSALLLSAFLILHDLMAAESGMARTLFVLIFLLFFAAGLFWRAHVERGQYYVLVLLLLAVGSIRCIRRGDNAVSGIVFGLAAAIRLTPVVMLVPLWQLGYRRTSIFAAMVFALGAAATMPWTGFELWRSYLTATTEHERFMSDPSFAAAERAKLPALPKTVEGVTFGNDLDDRSTNLSLVGLLPRLQAHTGIELFTQIPPGTFAKTAAILLAAAAMVSFSLGSFPAHAREQLAAVVMLVMCVDYCMPIRNGYADVLFLLPIGLLLPSMLVPRPAHLVCLAMLLCGLAFGHSMLVMGGAVTSRLRSAAVLGSLMVCCVMSFRSQRAATPRPAATVAEEDEDEHEPLIA